MPGGRSYSSTTRRTTTTADPGTSGTTLTVVDSTVFSSLDGDFPYTLLINWGLSDQEIVNVTARPSGTTLTIQRGQDGTSGVAHATGATVDHGVSARDFNPDPTPQVWTGFGHSYMQGFAGTVFTTGRFDQQFRAMMNVDIANWRNRAVPGAHLIQDGRQQGGWARVMQEVTHYQIGGQNIHGAPYWADNGAYLMCWGINDLGAITTTQANIRSAYQQCLRAVIVRARTSVVWENDYAASPGQPTYGAGFTVLAGTSDKSSGTSVHRATSTTNATITLTLPADYAGETVVLQFIANAGAVGGTVTFSGTAGVTGTLSTSNIIPSGVGTNAVPVVKRITTLTSANANQTIVCTVTAVDASGSVQFDYWGLEAKVANPVIVCNTPRVAPGGYGGYPNTFGDTEVAALNTAVSSVVAEFDGQVEVADLDTALNATAAYFASDGKHPNEIGGGRAAQACLNAVRRLAPSDALYPAANLTPSAPIASGYRRPRFPNQYYTTEFLGATSTAGLVSGDLYAMPFVVTESREIYVRLALEQIAAGTASATIRWGVYDDPGFSGYPQCLFDEATAGGAASLTLATGIKEQTNLYYHMDPGLWWIVFKCTGAGTGQTFTWMSGPDAWSVMPKLGATVGSGATLARNTTPIAWRLQTQGTGVLPTVFPPGASVVGTAPLIGLIKA